MTEKLSDIDTILKSIQINLKAPKDKNNNFGGFAYRNAEGILEALKEELKKEKYPDNIHIGFKFSLEGLNGRTFLKCTAFLEAGTASLIADAYAELELSKKGMDLAQLSGAATSYAKKYALCNLFAIDDSSDDPDNDKESKPKSDTQRLADVAGKDMQETLSNANALLFAKVKKQIEECGSLSEVEALKESRRADFNKLKKYAPDLFEMLIESGRIMKKTLDPNNDGFPG